MADTDFGPLAPARIDWQQDTPVAIDFDDPYFSRDNGAAESDHVFVAGNRLGERFRQLPPRALFVIGETGFGTGLNFLRAAACFLADAPGDARLHFISTEKHPLHIDDARRALHHQNAGSPLLAELLAHWPPACAGFHRRQFAQGRISLTLLQGDSVAMLKQCQAPVDAWFLDGFAPARNGAMWQPALFAELARLSRPGTTLATFTAAGFVRRGLAECGFAMGKIPGFGRKREMLAGHYGGPDQAPWQARQVSDGDVVVIGAGLAGATCARALADAGLSVTVLDPLGIAAAASGNLAGVVYTSPSAHPTPQNRFYQSSYLHALHWLAREGFPAGAEDGALSGVQQLPRDPRQADKARAALHSGLWPTDELQPLADSDDTLLLTRGGYLSPPRWCQRLLSHPGIRVVHEQAQTLTRDPSGWRVNTDRNTWLVGNVVLANSDQAPALLPLPAVKLKRIRGQVTHVRATENSRHWRQAICHAGYLTPAMNGLHCVGATFNLHDQNPAASTEDDVANLAELRQHLPAHWQALGGDQAQVAGQRVGFRCQSTDFLPLAGPVPSQPGLWLSIAHGSRGITGTPLCADLICAQMLGLPAPMDQEMIDALSPARFMLRQFSRSRSTP